MTKKEIVNTSLKFCFLPDLLFFALAYISWSFNNLEEHLLYAPFKSVSYILLYILAILSLYVKLYHWRELNVSFKSYIMFLLTCVQCSFYIWSIFLIIFYMKNPIYLQDLSIFSQYRYLSLFILLNILILFSAIIYITGYKITHLVPAITFPYIKEEIRSIMYTWNDKLFGPICNDLMEHLFTISNSRRIFYFSIHFIIFYLPRLLSMLFLLNFVYLGGDLRYVLLLVPIFFISWFLSFLDYYFSVYFENTGSYIRALLDVSLSDNPGSVPFKGIVEVSNGNIIFSLTSFALSRGYTQMGLSSLKQTWYLCARLAAYFMLYHRILFYFTRFLLVIQFINCFGIVYFFFF
jgi:hypothetical protein